MKEWNCSLKDTVKFFLTLATLAYVATGCGNAPHVALIDPEFAPYTAKFEQLALDNGLGVDYKVDVDMSFSLLPNTVAGKCVSATENALAYIVINPVFWAEYPDAVREQLISHELGHCMLNRKHNSKSTRDENGEMIPNSIMNPMLFSAATYQKYHANYVHELFKQGEF